MIDISRQIGGQEGELVHDCDAAADEVFAALVERQSRLVFRVAFSVLRNTHDAEDVAQETFLKLYRNGGWKKIEDERAFLARIAWRIAVDRRRKTRGSSTSNAQGKSVATPEHLALVSDWNGVVHRLIDALPPDLRQPLLLATIEELTSNQIARILGVPEGTVRTRIQRARQILKTKLASQVGGQHGNQ
jgi:RNA polymerase sigma-70 factor (ECF subfamily)